MTDGSAEKIKVAVLGGGVGALTTAYYLTEKEEDRRRYDVTVYQLGWRLGGKGASGRNMADGFGRRIEEHGLHIWMGFYYNAFRMIRAAYASPDRTPNQAFKDWTDAFKRHDLITMEESVRGKWIHWPIDFPELGKPNDVPGEGGEFPTPAGYVELLLEWMVRVFEDHVRKHHGVRPKPLLLRWLWRILGFLFGDIVKKFETSALHVARDLARGLARAPSDPGAAHHHAIATLLDKFLHWLWSELGKEIEGDNDARRLFILLDLAGSLVRGTLRDGILVPGEGGWGKIDDQEFHEWMVKHGLTDVSRWSAPVRAVYDLAFGYRDGIADEAHADMAAGSTCRGLLRMLLGYKGAIFFEMQAGMGDTIFTPLYEVLRARGVKFRYFHKVRDLIPAATGDAIERIELDVQATVKDDAEYRPLVMVRDLLSWPATPDYDQLVQGEELRARGVNLESWWSDWKPAGSLTLERGKDFDRIVLGTSLGPVPFICRRLVDQKPAWREMAKRVLLTRTQAFQLWLTPSAAALGWEARQSAVLGSYVEPLDTWADMTHLLPREDWKAPNLPGSIAYFCGPLEGEIPRGPDGLPDPKAFRDHAFPAKIEREVFARSRGFLETDIAHLWPKGVGRDGNGPLDWALLVDAADRKGLERLGSQFFRANIDPSELYVLSVKGSMPYRMKADDTGYSNLTVSGDWMWNFLNLGCVEAAVMGGMFAAEAVLGRKLPIVGTKDF